MCAQPDLALEFQIVLARSCVGIAAHFWCQVKDDELNFVTMKIIFYKCRGGSRNLRKGGHNILFFF